ncbi:MAG: helix-turn-helix domain-containing protein [Raineya sp.]|nr:helix-turn-helix domain-containing protein [Raineya sp.]
MKIGDKLLSLRNEFKLTQQEVADKLGIKQSTYHRWENGKTQPTIDFLPKIAEAYNIPITDLLPDTPHYIFQHNQETNGFINSNNNQYFYK